MSDQQNSFGEEVGLKGGFVVLRTFWNETKREYDRTEQSWDDENWEPYDEQHNTASIQYIGGPRDGKVEW